MSTKPHIDQVRQHVLDQMQSLRTAKPEDIERELKRAKGVSELAQVMVNTAKVEVDYIAATKQPSAPFLEPPVEVDSDSRTAGGGGLTLVGDGQKPPAEWPEDQRRVHRMKD
jgi:hypothetical protein